MYPFIETADVDWHPILRKALAAMDASYLESLSQSSTFLPEKARMFAAFTQPLSHTQYILLGESPYPRAKSANGYAFWDADVDQLWSESGLSKTVNRATSLRNILKMLLHARGDLTDDFSQAAIADLDKSTFCQTATDLFTQLMSKGFLLLNACLVYDTPLKPHLQYWQPFMDSLFAQLAEIKPSIQLILFGKIAAKIKSKEHFNLLMAEHPYNLSFIKNPDVLSFFKPLDLLTKT